jgi:hypothetical protein
MRALKHLLFASLILTVWSFSSLTVVAQTDQPSDQPPAADQPMETPTPQAAPPGPQSAPPPPYGEQAQAGRPYPGQPNADGQGQDQEPPNRVARLQYMNGSVSVQPQGTGDWVEGAINRPLTNADNVWADKNSRAEFNLGTGLLRIGPESSLTLTSVGDNAAQVTLHQGTLNAHIRHLFEGETYEVDTPNQAFTILRTGDYRFDVDPNGDATVVTVWRGEGEASGQGPAVRVKAHTQVRFTNGDSLTHVTDTAPDPDSFDEWCEGRDRRADSSRSSQYVSPDMVGSEDLDANGTWRNTPDYGNVWVPNGVGADWAPYTNGNWIWENPWGWTWVDYAPWGFAPFHYGRWVSFGGYWGWAPGPYYGGWARGWYAPALVSWYGGFGFGFGFGWCPLGFGEPFFPWYHYGWGYFRGINVFNSRFNNFDRFHAGFNNGWRGGDWQRRSVNMNARGGFHAISRNALEHGLPVNRNFSHVSESNLRNARPLNHLDASPSRDARLGGRAGAAGAPQRSLSRPTVSRSGTPSRTGGNNTGSFHPAERGPSGSQAAQGGHNVPRPPANMSRSNQANSNQANSNRGETGRNGESSMGSRSTPRPSENSNSARSRVNSVPRPTGRVLPAPRSYASDSRSSYSGRSNGESSGRYGGSSYGKPSYGGSPYGGSRGSYGGYSGHSSAPSHGYSAPHSSGGGSSHGGGSASSHGSSGGHSSGGGGGHGGGGGGHKGHR